MACSGVMISRPYDTQMYFDYLETRNTDVMQLMCSIMNGILSMALLCISTGCIKIRKEGRCLRILSIAKELRETIEYRRLQIGYRRCIQTAHKHSLSVEKQKEVGLSNQEASQSW